MNAAADLQNVVDAYPLTAMQEGMLFHTIVEPRSGVFVGQFTCELRGPLDEPAFRAAWGDLIARHAPLRTIFLWEGLDDPLQVVRDSVDLEWETADWRDIPPAERAHRLAAHLEADRTRGFDPGDAPLMRMCLLRTADDVHRWIWTAHHLISDGWSTSILLRELMDAYAARHRGEEPAFDPPVPFKSFVAWHAARDRVADESFWRRELSGLTEATPLPVGAPGTAAAAAAPSAGTADGRPRHQRIERRVPPALAARLATITRERRLTPSTLVQGAWSLLLARLADTDEVVVGVTTSGRPATLDGAEQAVGVFINTLPLRVPIEEDRTAAAWLGAVQERHLEVRAREHSSLADVQRWSELPSGTSLFDSIVVFENYPGGLVAGAPEAGLAMTGVEFIEQSNYPLAVLFMPGDPARVVLVHDGHEVDAATAATLADRLLHVLDQLAADLDRPVHAVDVLLPGERERLIGPMAGDAGSLDGGTVLPTRIAAVATRTPEAIAVRGADEALDHATLSDRADAVARVLRRRGIGAGDFVGLHVGRSVDIAIGIQAIHRAGAAYVPLDPAYPAAHRRRVLEHVGAALVLVGSGADPADDAEGLRIADAIRDGAEPRPEDVAASAPGSDDPAYVIHTSGSTGRPKGVLVPHRALAHSTAARDSVYGGAPARFLLMSSIAFDSSVAGIFWTLAGGGTLVIPPHRIEQDMGALAATIERDRVTHLLCLPAVYGLLLERAGDGQLASLETVIVAGEACPPDVVAAHHRRCPGVRLANEYGPTEGTVWCTVHETTPADVAGPVPIGRPIPGARVRVVDRRGRLVPPGATGELQLGGAGLADGYLGDTGGTDERFVRVPAGDGDDTLPERWYRTGDLACWRADETLEFRGRLDGQVKIRGHRVETDGVAAILRQEPDLADAVVDGRSVNGGPPRLVAWIEPMPGATITDPPARRTRLLADWPASMVPDLFVPVDTLPRLDNGKIDRTRLPDPAAAAAADAAARPASLPPRTDTERTLAGIWGEALGLETVGVHEDFFDLGGDSLLSIRVMSRIEQTFGRSLPLSSLLEHGTIEAVARLLDPEPAGAPATNGAVAHAAESASDPDADPDADADAGAELDSPSLVPFRREGSRPPLFCAHAGGGHVIEYRALARRLDDDQPVYGLEPIGLDGSRPPLDRIEDMATHYVAEIRRVQPEGPYRFVGHCTGATICWEMARQLQAMGEEVDLMVVIDSSPPGGHHDLRFTRKVFDYVRSNGLRTLPYIVRRLRARVGDQVLAPVRTGVNRRVGGPEQRRVATIAAVRAASERAFWSYEGTAASVPVLQIRSTEFAQIAGKDRHLAWDRFTDDLERHVITARHREILIEPAVAAVSELVAARIRQLDPASAEVES